MKSFPKICTRMNRVGREGWPSAKTTLADLLECGDTSPLLNDATCRVVPKRGHVRALQMVGRVYSRALFSLRTPSRCIGTLRTGFTLIELLVVITIIALLAALVVGGVSIANAKKAQSRVTTERDALITAIERYKKDKGFYPPDGNSDPACVSTPLFYELTGTELTVISGQTNFVSKLSGESVPISTLTSAFNMSGFINASTDPSSPAKDYFGGGLRTSQYMPVSYTNNGVPIKITILGVPVSGPVNLSAPAGTPTTLTYINPWHYNMSHPTNNIGSFDLWMDVKYGGHTNRISNWSPTPQPL